MPAGGSRQPASHETVDQRLHYVKQEGQTVFKFAVNNTGEVCERLLSRNNLTADDIDLFVSHQANRRIILSAAERLGLPPDKVVINIERFGNTTAATIPLALNDAVLPVASRRVIGCCWPRSAPASPSDQFCCAGGCPRPPFGRRAGLRPGGRFAEGRPSGGRASVLSGARTPAEL